MFVRNRAQGALASFATSSWLHLRNAALEQKGIESHSCVCMLCAPHILLRLQIDLMLPRATSQEPQRSRQHADLLLREKAVCTGANAHRSTHRKNSHENPGRQEEKEVDVVGEVISDETRPHNGKRWKHEHERQECRGGPPAHVSKLVYASASEPSSSLLTQQANAEMFALMQSLEGNGEEGQNESLNSGLVRQLPTATTMQEAMARLKSRNMLRGLHTVEEEIREAKSENDRKASFEGSR